MKAQERFNKRGAEFLDCVQPVVRQVAGHAEPVVVEFFQTADSCDGRSMHFKMTADEAEQLARRLLAVAEGARRA